MSEYELKDLIQSLSDSLYLDTEFWIAITSALIAVGYLAAARITPFLRYLIVLIYVAFASTAVFSWMNKVYAIWGYSEKLVVQGFTRAETIPLLGVVSVFVLFGGFVLGSIGALYYFLKQTSYNDDA